MVWETRYKVHAWNLEEGHGYGHTAKGNWSERRNTAMRTDTFSGPCKNERGIITTDEPSQIEVERLPPRPGAHAQDRTKNAGSHRHLFVRLNRPRRREAALGARQSRTSRLRKAFRAQDIPASLLDGSTNPPSPAAAHVGAATQVQRPRAVNA